MDQALLEIIEAVASRVPVITPDRQYWFIRTNRGQFYQNFWETDSVGIGYNMFSVGQINKMLAQGDKAYGELLKAIWKKYPDVDPNKAGRPAGLFLRFLTEMKEGDVVVMPSAGSAKYAFGIVTSGAPFDSGDPTPDENALYIKRRSVQWVTEKNWHDLDSNLYEAFRAPQALTKLNPFADYLDREMHAFYEKNGETHVRIDIKTLEGINGSDYFTMGSTLFALCQDFRNATGISLEGSEIEIRQNIQSPGVLEFIGKNKMVTGFLAAMLTLALAGGGHVKSKQLDSEVEVKGVLFPLLDFYKEYHKQENINAILHSKLESMDAEAATDLIRIVNGQQHTATESDTLPAKAPKVSFGDSTTVAPVPVLAPVAKPNPPHKAQS